MGSQARLWSVLLAVAVVAAVLMVASGFGGPRVEAAEAEAQAPQEVEEKQEKEKEAGDVGEKKDENEKGDDEDIDEAGAGAKEKGRWQRAKEKAKELAEKLKGGADALESILGAEVQPFFVAKGGGAYPDEQMHSDLEGLLLKMAEASERPHLPWQLVILNSSEVDSFAIPGGQIFVTRGLLARLDSEAQLAHVLGHQVAHVVHRHLIEKVGVGGLREALVGAAASAERRVLDKSPDDPTYVAAAAGVAGEIGFLKFSREQEVEADESGIEYVLAAGFDPREAKKTFEMFRLMKEQEGMNETAIRGLLSTHPHDSDRIEGIDSYLAEHHPEVAEGTVKLSVSGEAWLEHRKSLRRAERTYEKQAKALALIGAGTGGGSSVDREVAAAEALRLLDATLEELPDHASIHFGRGFGRHALGMTAGAEQDLDRAIELDGRLYQARLLRGVIRKDTERYELALEDLSAAAWLFPVGAAPHFYKGECHEALGSRLEALAAYKIAAFLAPEGSEMRKQAEAKLEALR